MGQVPTETTNTGFIELLRSHGLKEIKTIDIFMQYDFQQRLFVGNIKDNISYSKNGSFSDVVSHDVKKKHLWCPLSVFDS